MELRTSISKFGSSYGRKLAVRLLPVGVLAGSVVGVASLSTSANASVAAKTKTVVRLVKNAKYGKILVNSKGFALYTYSKDTKNHSNCTGQCISIWPALVVPSGDTPIGTNVTGLGTAMRSNGQRQVTYHSKPLYLFESDKKSGQVTGQGVGGFSVAKVTATGGTTTTTAPKSSWS